MIASDDVRRVTFDRAMRGYRCEDVDDYLKQVADSIDSLAAENDDLQKKLVILAQRIDQYRADEDTLSTTMINAQRLGENVIKEAKQKAAEIIRAANIKAEDREQRARDEVELAQQELVTIKQEADGPGPPAHRNDCQNSGVSHQPCRTAGRAAAAGTAGSPAAACIPAGRTACPGSAAGTGTQPANPGGCPGSAARSPGGKLPGI